MTWETGLLWFMIYSIIGWIYESIICSIGNKRLINRGFLNGPYCPIYGSGALLVIFVLGRIQSPFWLFLCGSTLCCLLEYATSYLMEKIFHARWWDYSKRKWNIKGRVCLLGAVVFGAFSVLLVRELHPWVRSFTDTFSENALHIISAVFLAVFLGDCVVTVKGFAGFRRKLDELSVFMEQQKNAAAERIHTSEVYKNMIELQLTVKKRLSLQQQRMIASFPKLKMKGSAYNDVLRKIRETLSRR